MSKLTKTLTVKKGSVVQNVPFYTTISEANQYGDYGTAIVDGVTAYYPLGSADSADTGSSHKTNMGCKKSGKNLYFLTKGNGELPSYNLVLSATSNQTITLKYKNRNYKDTGYESEITKTSTSSAQTFSVRKGTTFTATVTGATGYNAGAISAASGTVNAAITVSAGAASLKTYSLTLAGTSNQTITLKYTEPGGSAVTKTSTGSNQAFTVKHGTTWTATITASTGWTAGALSATSGTVTAATTISAAAATYKTFTLTKSATNASTNQTLTVKYKNYNGSSYASEATLSSGSATVGYGTTWTASVSPSTGFNAGALSPGSSGTATANVTVSVGAATRKTFTLTLAKTTNQTITLKYTQPGASAVTKTSTSSNQSFTVQYGTTWTASVAAANGYTAGKLSASSGTITGNTTVSAGAATLSGFTVTFKSDKKVLYEEREFFDKWTHIVFSVSYTNASGSIVNTGELEHTTGNEVNTFIVKPNTKVTITARPTVDTYELYLYKDNKLVDVFPQQYPAGSVAPITITQNTTFEFKVRYLLVH